MQKCLRVGFCSLQTIDSYLHIKSKQTVDFNKFGTYDFSNAINIGRNIECRFHNAMRVNTAPSNGNEAMETNNSETMENMAYNYLRNMVNSSSIRRNYLRISYN